MSDPRQPNRFEKKKNIPRHASLRELSTRAHDNLNDSVFLVAILLVHGRRVFEARRMRVEPSSITSPIFVSENISVLHGRLISVKQMKIGTTDGTGGDLDDCISRMLNLGIRERYRRERRLCRANIVRTWSSSIPFKRTACTVTGHVVQAQQT